MSWSNDIQALRNHDELALVAVRVGNTATGHRYWDVHLVTVHDETGGLLGPEGDDIGWSLDSVSLWRPVELGLPDAEEWEQ